MIADKYRATMLLAAAVLAPSIVASSSAVRGSAPAPARAASIASGAIAWKAPVRHRQTADSLWFVTADTGNHARYRVREQLVGIDLPSDAVGTTDAVTGTIIIGVNGKVSTQSRFLIDVRVLKSDRDRRDGYVQNRILETAKFPTVTFAITGFDKLHLPLPAAGSQGFALTGDLTVHGITKPVTWRGTANLSGKEVSGTAETMFTFEDFGLLKPHVPVLLSVADTIALEYAFRMVRK